MDDKDKQFQNSLQENEAHPNSVLYMNYSEGYPF